MLSYTAAAAVAAVKKGEKMNMRVTRELTESVKRAYPRGCRVKLVKMNDDQAPPVGTCGTVSFVDDIGTIHVKWDNGSSLGVVFGEDSCKKID